MFQIYSFISVPAFLFAAFLITIVGHRRNDYPEKIALCASVTGIILFLATLPGISGKEHMAYTLGGWTAPYGITIGFDGMSAVFSAIVLLAMLFVILFSPGNVERPGTEYYALLTLLGAGLLGVTHTADLFNMFVFFEIMSISSYALSCYGKNPGAYKAAINYLVLSSFGTSLLLLGIAFIYGVTGTLNMADIALKISMMSVKNTALLVAYSMIAIGVLLKAAVVPLHSWKPAVLKFATPQISALFASASATTALYAFFRVSYTIYGLAESATFHNILILAGITTMVLGAAMAFAQRNILSLLAYSAISQVGYVLLAFGIKDYTAGVFHSLNIAVIELALFLSAGLIVRHAGSSDLGVIGSANVNNPALYWVTLAAFLSNAGVPLLGGFASKWMIYVSGAERAPFAALVAILVTMMTVAYSFKAFGMLFRGKNGKTINIPPRIQACLFILAGIMIFFGIFYAIGINISEDAVNSLVGQGEFISASLGKVN